MSAAVSLVLIFLLVSNQKCQILSDSQQLLARDIRKIMQIEFFCHQKTSLTFPEDIRNAQFRDASLCIIIFQTNQDWEG